MKEKILDENDFIIGIDIGNYASSVSYFNFNQMLIDIVDASGGYGKISIPTVASYSTNSDEWIFGEYALLNKGFSDDIIFENIIENLGEGLEYNINGKRVKLTYILSRYLLFLIENIRNINPNFQIKGIVLSVLSYTNENILKDIEESFKLADLDKYLIKIVDNRECLLKGYFYENQLDGDKILIIDYGNRQIRASIYEMIEKGSFKCIKAVAKSHIGQHRIYNITKNLMTKKFLEETGKIKLNDYEQNQIDIFSEQQFDLIFQRKSIEDIKIYYNFYYPPFQKIITKEEIFDIISYFEREINLFFNEFFKDIQITENEIKNIILTGGGMEIDFINRFIKSKFHMKNDLKGQFKRAISDGACIIACQETGAMPKTWLEIEDLNKVKNNIGIFIDELGKDKFLPFIHKNNFIWQESEKLIFNLTKEEKLDFNVYIEEDNGYVPIKKIEIDLPNELKRDKRTVRFLIEMSFVNSENILFKIEDFGFGDIFPKTEFKKEIEINLNARV